MIWWGKEYLSLWSDFHFLWCHHSVISNLSISSNVKQRVCSCRPWSMWQLCLSFYQRSNNSDRFVNLASHFICVQIFQIYFSLKSEKNPISNFPLQLPHSALHYAAIESNRELNKSLKVIALLLLIFGPNMLFLFLTGVKP